MKKLLILLLLLSSFFSIAIVDAVSIEVTEPIPGAGCSKWWESDWDVYTCYIQNGFGGVTGVIGEIIKYFTYITSLAAVLFIVINGILYSMAGINDWLKSGAKDRITKTLIGLILLMLSWLILNAIAPWVYK